jgi:hypothetical protein
MLIEVTQDHIEKGKTRGCFDCPIALAMIDAGLRHPFVMNTIVSTASSSCDMDLPQEAVEFIAGFDTGGFVKPFSFELDLEAARVD